MRKKSLLPAPLHLALTVWATFAMVGGALINGLVIGEFTALGLPWYVWGVLVPYVGALFLVAATINSRVHWGGLA